MAIELTEFSHFTFNTDSIIPVSPMEWIQRLPGPVVIDVAGQDPSRTRVISTLLHANEPSGFIAVHRWLRSWLSVQRQRSPSSVLSVQPDANKLSKFLPATNVRFLLSSVEAAKQLPLFHQRFVDGDADLNRLFSLAQVESPAHQRAADIKQLITEVTPEAVVDLHNTSGIGHPFSVSIHADKTEQQLASYFCKNMIHTHLRMGSLMEQDFSCPIVTIECGGVSDEMSHEVAYQGITSFLNAKSLEVGHHLPMAKIYTQPLRVELDQDTSLSYAKELNPATDITLVEHIEQYNLDVTGANTLIGWSKSESLPIHIKTERGERHNVPLLKCENNEIRTIRPLRIFMATPVAVIAKKDCLFYAVLEE